MNSMKKNSARKNSGLKPQSNFGLNNFQGLIKEEMPEPTIRERGSSFSKKGPFLDSSLYTNEIFIDSAQKNRREEAYPNNSIVTGGFKFDTLATSIKKDNDIFKDRNENNQKQNASAFKKVFWRPQSVALEKPGPENDGWEPERETHRPPLNYTTRFNITKPGNNTLANLHEEKKSLENTRSLRATTTLFDDNFESEIPESLMTQPLSWQTKDGFISTRDTKENVPKEVREIFRETKESRPTSRDLNNEFSLERKEGKNKIYEMQNLQKSFEISQNLLSQQLQVINDHRTTNNTFNSNPRTLPTERDLSRRESQETRNSTILKMVPLSHRETLLYVVENRLLQPNFGLNSLKESVSNIDERWHENLIKKCKRAIGIMKEEGKSLNHILEKRGKIIGDKEHLMRNIESQREKIKILQKTSNRKTFEEETKAEMELLRERLDNIDDLLHETETLITIILMGTGDDQFKHLPHYSEIKNVDVYSQSTSLFTEYQRWMKSIETNLTEYKRVYKLDFNSEDFQKKAQILVTMLKESEEFLGEARTSTTRLNTVMVVELKYLCDLIRDESNKMQDTYAEIEESFDLVNQLEYIRKKKITEYQNNLVRFKSTVSTVQSPFNIVQNRAANNKTLGELIDSLQNLLKEVKVKKKEVKAYRYDPKTQYFLALRLKQTTTIIDEMKVIEKNGESILVFVRFCKDNLSKLEEKYMLLNSKADLVVNQANAIIKGENFSSEELRKLKVLYQEMNKVINEHSLLKEEFEEKVKAHNFTKFSSSVENLLSSLTSSIDKIYKIQDQMIPFMKYDLSKYDQAKSETKQILEESERFKHHLKDNEELIYNFDKTEKLANSTNKIQSSLFRISGTLLVLRDKIKMDRISNDLTLLYEKVELENKNFNALKVMFDNNCYFTSSNIETITFEEDKDDFEILDQILEMVGDLLSDYKKHVFSVDTLSSIVKTSATKIYELAVFLKEIIERWMDFDKNFRKIMQNKDSVSKYREILEEMYHSLQARIVAFDSEKTFKGFFFVFQERLETYYKGVHNFIDNINPYEVDKAIKWLTLNKNDLLTKTYVQKLDELFKYIERHPSENDERERLDILLNTHIAEKFEEASTINYLLSWEIENIDSNLIPGYENMMKGKEDITKFLAICSLNYRLFANFVELFKESTDKWNSTFTFNDPNFCELFKKQKAFFQKEYKGIITEIDSLVPEIENSDFRKVVELRLFECQSNFNQLLERLNIKQDKELEFAACLLETSINFKPRLDDLVADVVRSVGGDIVGTKSKLDALKEFLNLYDENSGIGKPLFDDNISKKANSEIQQLDQSILFFNFIRGFEMIRELRATHETDVWIPFVAVLCSHVDAKKDRKVKVTRLVVRKELEDKIRLNTQRSELLQLFQDKI